MTCGDAVSIAPRPPRGRPAQTAGYQLFGHRSGAATHRPSHAGGAGSADRIRTGVLAILETARDYPCATASPAAIVVPSGSRAVCASPFSFVALAGSLSYGHTSRYEAPGGCWRVKAVVVVAVPRCCTPTPTWWSRHPARWRSIISRQRRAGRRRERGRSQSRCLICVGRLRAVSSSRRPSALSWTRRTSGESSARSLPGPRRCPVSTSHHMSGPLGRPGRLRLDPVGRGIPLEEISRLVDHSSTAVGGGLQEADPGGDPDRCDGHGRHLRYSRASGAVVTQIDTHNVGGPVLKTVPAL